MGGKFKRQSRGSSGCEDQPAGDDCDCRQAVCWADVAEAIVRVVDMPFGKRPFRVHIDPVNDGAEVVNGAADRVRVELLRNVGLSDLLKPTKPHQS
jgi:hypothetical protein